MKTFVMMTKVASQDAALVEVASRLQHRERLGTTWVDKVKEKCPQVKFLAHYLLLGPWDYMDIYEAPDEEVAAMVSIISRAHGAHQVESWVAIPNKQLDKLGEACDE
ncbi:MAG TPA: GYD domain-containing protein [Acidobacteriota bacterium]|nr:GYD domain-containing protein [Acidobacteriota bacterium]